jgi:uncharacterized protein YbjT (DUF2867 family)
MNVLVLGATGRTGRRVTAALLARTLGVRAASRIPAPARTGVTPVVFDWADKATWAGVGGDATAMYLIGPGPLFDQGPLIEKLLADLPGIRRVVVLSDIGAAVGAGSLNLEMERAIQRSGREWTVLRPNWFQQNFTESPLFTADIAERGEIVAPVGDAQVSFIDVIDIAEIAAITLTTDGHDGRTYVLTGPRALTFGQVAAELSTVGRTVRHVDPIWEEMARLMARNGVPAAMISVIGARFQRIRDGVTSPVTDTVERITGRPARPFTAIPAAHASR